MPKCIMLIGLPGVGKSTWLKNNMPEATVASSDSYIEECARSLGATYSEIFTYIIKYAERAFHNDINTLAFNGYDFVVDRTNLHKKSRKQIMDRVMKNAKEAYEFEAIVFNTPSDREHMDRLASRHGKNIPNDVMESMKRMYTPPTNFEGFANIRFIG